MFSAMAVQSAVAAPTKSVRTTAFTCQKEETQNFKFEDVHCTKETIPPNKGFYNHVEIAKDVTTGIEVSKKPGSANPKLIGEAFGVKAEVECEKANGTGNVHNVESGGAEKKHTVTGIIIFIFDGNCRVSNQPNCTVQKEIKAETVYEGVEGEVKKGGSKEMGVEFKPKEGTIFTTLEFGSKEGKLCLLPAKAEITGTLVATGVGSGETPSYSGAIGVFTKAMTEETLKFAGNKASFTLECTIEMEKKAGLTQNPIVFTTLT
jgi:hypothetical protein